METYECEICSGIFEIESIEAALGHHEYYEQGLCQECFDMELEEETE